MGQEDTRPHNQTTSENASETRNDPASGTGIKFTWLIVFLVLCLGLFVGIGFIEPMEGAHTFLRTFVVLPLTLLLTMIWWSFLSGVKTRDRLAGLGVVLLLGGSVAACVRDVDFEGDMLPIVRWRWQPDAETLARQAKLEQAGNEVEIAADLKLAITEDDWPQFRNDDREGRDMTVQLDRDFAANPPEELWRIKVGLGWSSFAIVDDFCWTQEQIDDRELVVCYELETGKQVWSHADEARWSETMGGDGPRATPTIHEGKCYTQGATGILNCLDALTGEVIWSRNILEDAGAKNIQWAMSASPLIYEDKVIVNPGGQNGKGVIAYDKRNGEIIWAKGDHPASYAGLRVAEMHGEPQLILFDGDGVAGLDPQDGAEYWRYEWTNGPKVNAAQPIVLGYQILISSGYNTGSALLNVSREEEKWSVEPEWIAKNRFRLKFSDGVLKDGFVYGLDEDLMSCIEFQSGKRQWRARSNTGYGQLILLGDLLTIITEQGDLVFAEATPEKWTELFRMPALPGKTWNNPAYSRGYLLVRNDREAVCYRLKLAE